MKTMIIEIFRLICGLLLIGNLVYAADNRPPIVVGATVSLEGKYLEPSLMIQKAFLFWIKEINQNNGLHGRKVKLILYNDKSNVDLTRILYKKLIEQDKVDLVFSPYSTPLTLVASEISEQHNMLMLAVAAAGEKPWQRNFRYLFQLYAPAKRQFIGLLDMMAKNKYKSLSLLYDDSSDFNIDIIKGILEWAKIYKIDILTKKSYQDGKKELPGLLQEVKAKGAEGLVLSAYPPDSYELLRLLEKMSYKPTVLAMPIAPVHPDFQKTVGDIANHILSPSQWEPDERIPFPGTRSFIEGFSIFANHLPSFHAASAYAACQLFEQAISRTQSFDNQKLRDYIAALNTVTVLGRFKVDFTGKQIGHNSFIIQWQKGKKEIVWPQKMQTSQAIF
ncbi:MAG: amino acid ABC transporter substrate-binding protein [Deltaproteobacteria bacterium]|jgi:branched-chain amino acid transport system substrate-binding protein|nr:amino acid ABC transporter substrate-binding protein [Deltaproteobacteria bacterium]